MTPHFICHSSYLKNFTDVHTAATLICSVSVLSCPPPVSVIYCTIGQYSIRSDLPQNPGTQLNLVFPKIKLFPKIELFCKIKLFRKIVVFRKVQMLRIFCIPHVFRKVQLGTAQYLWLVRDRKYNIWDKDFFLTVWIRDKKFF